MKVEDIPAEAFEPGLCGHESDTGGCNTPAMLRMVMYCSGCEKDYSEAVCDKHVDFFRQVIRQSWRLRCLHCNSFMAKFRLQGFPRAPEEYRGKGLRLTENMKYSPVRQPVEV